MSIFDKITSMFGAKDEGAGGDTPMPAAADEPMPEGEEPAVAPPAEEAPATPPAEGEAPDTPQPGVIMPEGGEEKKEGEM